MMVWIPERAPRLRPRLSLDFLGFLGFCRVYVGFHRCSKSVFLF